MTQDSVAARDRISGWVSVIIPTFNRRELLRRCLNHLSSQTYRSFEVCVVNDGGAQVADVITPFRDRLSITLIEQPVNQGSVACRNVGLRATQGEFVAFCDDDDVLLPNHLTTVLQRLADADLAYSDVIVRGRLEDGQKPPEEFLFSFEHDPEVLRRTNYIVPSSAIYRRLLHDHLGPLDERAGHYWDWDWFLRVSAVGRIGHVGVTTVIYDFRIEGDNASVNPDRHVTDLGYLCRKHDLGQLPSTNFYLMAKHGVGHLHT
jgi:glycosyltransferase involved in cell wall biosynthesis